MSCKCFIIKTFSCLKHAPWTSTLNFQNCDSELRFNFKFRLYVFVSWFYFERFVICRKTMIYLKSFIVLIHINQCLSSWWFRSRHTFKTVIRPLQQTSVTWLYTVPKIRVIWDWLVVPGAVASISILSKVQIPHIILCQLQHKLTKRIQMNNWLRFVVGLTGRQHSELSTVSLFTSQEMPSSLLKSSTQWTGSFYFQRGRIHLWKCLSLSPN